MVLKRAKAEADLMRIDSLTEGETRPKTKTFDSPTVVDEMEGGEMLLCSQV